MLITSQSLSFALAGVFGLDIYVISLFEPTLTEEDLGQLFTYLPKRCLVLLEDIDTAGLIRTEKDEDDENKKGISLSGLLNAIDGVASHEGRVLVMTTNKPEKLDDALIHPGRVDLQVAFTNATQEQVKELFLRMYALDKPNPRLSLTLQEQNFLENPVTPPSAPSTRDKSSILHTERPGRSLEEIATEFARGIPDYKFSPAEIQGFLLKRKKDPEKACREVKAWVKSMMELKAKVLGVQQDINVLYDLNEALTSLRGILLLAYYSSLASPGRTRYAMSTNTSLKIKPYRHRQHSWQI